MSPQDAFWTIAGAVAGTARECGRQVFVAGVELHRQTASPPDAFFEAVWAEASDQLWHLIADAMRTAGLTDPETVETLQWIACEEFDGEFDRLNEAWMGTGGRA